MRIHLFHTNDVHSQLENWMRLGARLRALREDAISQAQMAFTFDIGDVLDRVRPETEATLGQVNAAMMAALGYDAWVFGNNEGLTIPVAQWAQMVADSETVVLGTNMRQRSGERFPGFEDTRVLHADGVRIGVFGLTPDYREPYELLPVEVSNPTAAAREAVQQLRAQGCHAIVCLSHLGLRTDRALAADVPGIDVILGGHTHQFMTEPEVIRGTYVFQPGKHALAFGHTTMAFNESQQLTGVTCEAVPVDVHGALDAGMFRAYQQYGREVDVRLSRMVATLADPLPVQLDRESPFANVLVDSLMYRYECDVAVMMAGCLNASLCAGTVSWRHIHGACPTPTRPVLLTLTGRQLRGIIEQGMDPDTYNRPGFGFGFRGGVIGWLALAGATVTMTGADDRLQLKEIEIDGAPLEDGRSYRVATCEYLWLSPVFPGFRQGQDVEVQTPLVREVLVDYMKWADLQPKPRYQMDDSEEI